MPLIAHNNLPTFSRLAAEGVKVLKPTIATHQDIRELHIGLLNMMPDAALSATERQFFRLIGQSNPIAQFYVHPFTLNDLPRGVEAQHYIDTHYESFQQIAEKGLDALIITGANVTQADLSAEVFWRALIEVVDWADENVTSTLCSCLATHAVLEFRYGQKRRHLEQKKWGVFEHRVVDPHHPLITDINTRFSVPHSRWNSIDPDQFDAAGLRILVTADDGCVHLATSEDGIRTVFFQGHPEYDTVTLLKEYKREVERYLQAETDTPPVMPEHYFDAFASAVLREYLYRHGTIGQKMGQTLVFPDLQGIDNTWHDSACAVISNWVGLTYQITDKDRKIPFMPGVDPLNPLNL